MAFPDSFALLKLRIDLIVSGSEAVTLLAPGTTCEVNVGGTGYKKATMASCSMKSDCGWMLCRGTGMTFCCSDRMW